MSVPGWGGVRDGKNQHYNNIVAPQQLQQMYQPRFQGSLPPVPAEREEGWKREPGNEVAKVQDSRLHTV